jgi:hypothetical protein
MKFSKLIVALVIALNVLFTVAVLFIFYKVGTEPTTLIGAWFGFTTIELWALAGIKKREIDAERREMEWKENGSTGY